MHFCEEAVLLIKATKLDRVLLDSTRDKKKRKKSHGRSQLFEVKPANMQTSHTCRVLET